MKSLSTFGLINIGVLVKVGLMSSKDFLASIIHFMVESFFSMLFSDLINSAKLETNLLRKLIFPKKACNYLMFLRCFICKMASILAGSIRYHLLRLCDLITFLLLTRTKTSWGSKKFHTSCI